jgi:copper chaperone CopZ
MHFQHYRGALTLLSLVVAGCSDETERVTVESSTPAAFNAAQSPTVAFALPDMMCEDGCAQAVEDILERQPGAKDVQVDFEGKTATVAIEDGVFDSQQALAALVDKGFDNSKLVPSDGVDAADVTSDTPSEAQ